MWSALISLWDQIWISSSCPVLTCCQESADLSILEPSRAAPCSQSKQGREAFSAELHAQTEKPEPGWITHTASWSLEDGCSSERFVHYSAAQKQTCCSATTRPEVKCWSCCLFQSCAEVQRVNLSLQMCKCDHAPSLKFFTRNSVAVCLQNKRGHICSGLRLNNTSLWIHLNQEPYRFRSRLIRSTGSESGPLLLPVLCVCVCVCVSAGGEDASISNHGNNKQSLL